MNVVEEYNCYRYNEEWYLIEMILNIKPRNILFDEFVVPEKGVQPNNWQTAFLEQYLNESGTEKICDLYDVPKDEFPYSHIVFFIYKADAYVLRTPYGEFQLSSEMEIPRRLQQIIEVDEDYM